MSHIGKKVISIPAGVTARLEGGGIAITGPKGQLSFSIHPLIEVAIGDNTITCSIKRMTKQSKALWGTTRARIQNLVTGVTEGFSKQLEMHGVGYRASLKGKDIELLIGFSHPVLFPAPEGVTFAVQKEVITVSGIDVQQVGEMAAQLRAIRPPVPDKGKGIRYTGEIIRRIVGKVVGTTA